MLKIMVALASLFITQVIFASSIPEKSETDFNQTISKVLKQYEQSLSKPLVIEKNWSDVRLDVIPRDKGAYYHLYVSGGILREKAVTIDAFALMICHELGHFAGGLPIFGKEAKSAEEFNLTSEGQSDFWAASKCFRKVFRDDDNVQFIKNFKLKNGKRFLFKEFLPMANQKCSESWGSNLNRVALCERTILAARSYARIARIKGNEKHWVNITTPSVIEAPYTNVAHAPAQCRLDTFIAGALCGISEDVSVSFENLDTGMCTRKKGYGSISRPLCWYKPPKN